MDKLSNWLIISTLSSYCKAKSQYLLLRCQCLYAVPAVFQGPGRLSVVGSLFAALTVYHVTVAKLAIRQVSLNPSNNNHNNWNLSIFYYSHVIFDHWLLEMSCSFFFDPRPCKSLYPQEGGVLGIWFLGYNPDSDLCHGCLPHYSQLCSLCLS